MVSRASAATNALLGDKVATIGLLPRRRISMLQLRVITGSAAKNGYAFSAVPTKNYVRQYWC